MSSITQDVAVNDGISKITVTCFRARKAYAALPVPFRVMLWPMNIVASVFMVLIGCDMPASVQAGPRLRIPHGGRGIVMHPSTVLGDDCTVYHQVTIGIAKNSGTAAKIGNGAYIGTGAILLGPVQIGDNASIGAGAVVVDDVPSGRTAVSPKAKLLP